MNTKKLSSDLEMALSGIGATLRRRLWTAYLDLKRNCAESRYEAAGIAAGKFCEATLRHLQHRVFGRYTPLNAKICNFADECRKLITASVGTSSESERAIMPRALVFLYTMRSKRGISHVGGDVDANRIDIAVMARVADWVICELIRIHHGLSLEEAQNLVDSITMRELPTIWEVNGKKRVLKEGLKAADQVLLLLYSSKEKSVLVSDLCSWIEYSNPHTFKTRVIGKLHSQRLVEHDKQTESVMISPKGVKYVEEILL
jgi:hypothetical protein